MVASYNQVELFGLVIVLGLGLLAISGSVRAWLASRQKLVELALIPPLGNDRSPVAMTNFCLALARLIEQRPLSARLCGFYPTWQMLILADKRRGCRFVWRLPTSARQAAERLVVAYWPGVRIEVGRVGGLAGLKSVARFCPGPDLVVSGSAVDWQQSDPVGYLTSQLSTVSSGGPVGYAIDLRPRTAGPLTGDNLAGWLLGLVGRFADGLLTLFHPVTAPRASVTAQASVEPPPAAERPELSLSVRLVSARSLPGPALSGLQSALGLMGLKHKRFGRWSAASPGQLGQLWHFPNSTSSPPDDLTHSLSRTLPVPTALLPGPEPDDLILGLSNHRGDRRPLYLKPPDRQRHVYIVGGTGTGKTTMLKDQIIQDMRAGRGVGVIDPHGDLATELLDHVPSSRVDDLIYFDPDNFADPIGINLLEIPPGLDQNELARQKDLVTESTVSVMRKLFAADGEGGHRIEYILRNSIQTALELPNPTLFTIYDLLQNPQFRRQAIANLSNPHLKLFWQQELGKAGEYQRVKMTAGVTAKIGRFLFSTPTQLTFGQVRSTIDFLEIMDDSSILICNLSRGVLGEDTSRLFGATILAKIQLAALARARQSFASRRPFYLYVDEFQNFATVSFVEMLSESRKYQVLLTIAEQSTQQQFDQRLTEVILANVGTIVAFRSGSPADTQMLGPLFEPFAASVELMNLPAYCFYARVGTLNPVELVSGITRVGKTQT